MRGYLKIFWAIFIFCSNWPAILLHKLFNFSLRQLRLRNGIIFVNPNGKLGPADLSMFAEIWKERYYNPAFFSLRNNDVIFDVGGNSGYFSVYAAALARQGQVHVFEPVPALAEAIRQNAKINNLQNIKVEEAALSGRSGQSEFYLSKAHNGCHSLYRRDPQDLAITVKLETLAQYCAENKIEVINFLKMDCEGAEYDIILNLSPEMLLKIEKISMEYHDVINQHRHGELVEFLTAHNFLVDIQGGYLYALNLERQDLLVESYI